MKMVLQTWIENNNIIFYPTWKQNELLVCMEVARFGRIYIWKVQKKKVNTEEDGDAAAVNID